MSEWTLVSQLITLSKQNKKWERERMREAIFDIILIENKPVIAGKFSICQISLN